jgi:hypothetical protein
VDGNSYIDSTDMGVPGFGNKRQRLDVAQKIVAANQPGTAVRVYYDPGDPAHSLLRDSVPWNVYMRLSVAVFFSLVSLAVTVLATIETRRTGKHAAHGNRQVSATKS